jgi:glycosyltransferase involved in cell wall biosynthesis
MALPSVAVVIPHYDQFQYLEECLRSVQQQTFTDWEAIVVDDASPHDDAVALVEKLNDPRLKLIRNSSNCGPGSSRNTGFQASRAHLVLPLDADDCLEPTFLKATKQALEQHPDVDCVYTEFQLFGSSNQIWRFDPRPPEEILTHQWIPGPGTLMRKSFWSAVGGYSESAQLAGNEDWEFWIRAVRHGCKPMKIPEALYRYRRHAESATARSLPYRDYLTREIIYQAHREFFTQHDAGAQFRGEGYLNSSVASLKLGERSRAVWLALRGLLVEPRNRYLRRHLARSLTPELVIHAVRPLRNRPTDERS